MSDTILATDIFSNGAVKKAIAWIVASGTLALLVRWAVRAFVSATDIDCGYNWSFDGTMDNPRNMRPNLDLRNRSGLRTYRMANIKYELRGQRHWFDNTSIMGKELKPGSIEFINNIAPVPRIALLKECMEMRVSLHTQDGNEIVAYGPGQEQSKLAYRMGRLRIWLNKLSVKVE